jgi:hypothetical protein
MCLDVDTGVEITPREIVRWMIEEGQALKSSSSLKTDIALPSLVIKGMLMMIQKYPRLRGSSLLYHNGHGGGEKSEFQESQGDKTHASNTNPTASANCL